MVLDLWTLRDEDLILSGTYFKSNTRPRAVVKTQGVGVGGQGSYWAVEDCVRNVYVMMRLHRSRGRHGPGLQPSRRSQEAMEERIQEYSSISEARELKG